MLYSIVIPCYKSSHTLRQVVEETAAEMERLGRVPFEFILVDDHSPDDGATAALIRELADDYSFVTGVALAKNGGQHNATLAGLHYANGDAVISMDDDGQTHWSQLCKLFEKYDEGYDIVFGYYPDKKHSAFRNFGSWVNFNTVRIFIGKPKDMKTSSFWVIRKYVRDYMIQYESKYTHLQGLFLRTTSVDKITSVPVEHFERAYGTSNYTFKKLVGLWSNIMGFSILPLKLAQYVGLFFSAVGFIGALVILIRKLIHPAIVMGWSSMMFALFFFSGMIILFLGIIGEYIGKLYQNVNKQPQYVVRNIYEGKKDDK